MRTRFIAFIFFFALISCLNSQDTWVKTYRPFQRPYWTDSYEVQDVLLSQDGGFVVSGSYELHGDLPWDYEHWGFLMKTDSDGNMLWAASDSVDFLIESDNRAFLETPEGDFISTTTCYYGGSALIKHDSEGNRLWELNSNEFYAHSMCLTDDNNMILGGRHNGLPAVQKRTLDGSVIWTQDYYLSGSGVGAVYSICQTSDFGYAVTGYTSGNGYDLFILKTNSLGDSLWMDIIDYTGDQDQGNCIIEMDNTDLVIIGENHSRSIETYLARYNYLGSNLWSNIFTELAAGISINKSLDQHIIGYSWSVGSVKLFKYNGTEFIWSEDLSIYPAEGDRTFLELDNGHFICIGVNNNSSMFSIIRTDSNGNYTSFTNNIVLPYVVTHPIPNPFNPVTKIQFGILPEYDDASIEIFNSKGQIVKQISLDCGQQSILWDGTDDQNKKVCSGPYFYTINSGKTKLGSGKMVLMK